MAPGIALVFALAAAMRVVLGDCASCATADGCSTAYEGLPGHFCGHWAGAPCCCPENHICVPTRVTCQCNSLAIAPATNAPDPSHGFAHARLGGLVAVFAWLCCFFCLYFACYKRMSPAFSRQRFYVSIPPAHIGANVYAMPTAQGMHYPTQPQAGGEADILLLPQHQQHVQLDVAAPPPPPPRWSRSHVAGGTLSLPKIRT
ncbi:Aste57867_23258 [Aphanomyces stellatus]|uniref:Aste57867_23258 protein n=1 Tax=Aphanomyces stellatus TaxID=120398 RepID=A0A485LM88_9STRA|nr:hypothetical protein As57867_023187 [Aphanomyces stellatus]VFT99903.1 Aste57867_23258 [Aphanomyces stellatus]